MATAFMTALRRPRPAQSPADTRRRAFPSCRQAVRAATLSMLVVSTLVSGAVHAESYVLLANHQVVGALQTVQARYEETLTDIARVHRLGYEEIVRANPGVDVWLPGEGTEVRLP